MSQERFGPAFGLMGILGVLAVLASVGILMLWLGAAW